ncbi:MAG: riboflavin synthase [Planctomycetota bacterium]
MFTGLVQAVGRVESLEERGATTRLAIRVDGWPHRPEQGASIAVNGCCLTVVAPATDAHPVLGFDCIPQTLAVTSLGRLRAGAGVNLEHAATPATFLGGHVVLGHVDGLATVVEVRTAGEWRVRLRLPGDLARHAVDKGSVALDGVSLTIARVEGDTIDVCLIPETLEKTNLRERAAGDVLNIEVDYLSKLVARQLEWLKAR